MIENIIKLSPNIYIKKETEFINIQGTTQTIIQNNTEIFIKDKWYNIIPLINLSKQSDNKYHYIYIQINWDTGEYYIGKSNKKNFSEVRRYQGSGVKFTNKFNLHKDKFERFIIVNCKTQKDTEIIEESIVTRELLNDKKCLNLITGGHGGQKYISTDALRLKKKLYMKNHPEQYTPMIDAAKKIFQNPNSIQLQTRNKHIKETMSSDKYKKMTSERILKWKKNHPEEYKKSRENNKKSINTEECKKKKQEAFQKWKENNPEQYIENMNKRIQSCHSIEAQTKRKNSLKKWREENPQKAKEYAKKRAKAASKKTSKPIRMINIDTGETVKIFQSQHEAARWLVENNYSKTINCINSISMVCRKKKIEGHGVRKQAYGFGWEFLE